MKQSRAKRSGAAAGLLSVLPWLLAGSDLTGRAAEVPSHGPGQILSPSKPKAEPAAPAGDIAPEATRAAAPMDERVGNEQSRRDPVGLRDDGSDGGDLSLGLQSARSQASTPPAPHVAVRVGDHGDYQRVVFEWPERIAYDVAQEGEQVTVAFSRAGRIDFSAVRDRLGGRVLEAQTAGAGATRRIVLRVLPGASIRSFGLEGDRIVVIDVLGGSASPRPASAAPALRVTADVIQDEPAPPDSSGTVSRPPAQASEAPAPRVAVRVGHHGAFERIAFEWPEAIGHEVVRRADRVTVGFSRPGKIDISAVRDRFGERMLEAWSDRGDATSQVTLRVRPSAEIRSFTLENDRIVVVDVIGGSTPQSVARPESGPAPDPVHELRRELEQRDAVIEGLLARVEQLERGAVLSGDDLDRIAAGRAPSAGDRAVPQPGAPSPAAAEQGPSGPASQEETAAGDSRGRDHAAAQAQPGQLEVDEDEIDRALERTLVQTGVLLLPLGQAETEPFFSYTRQETGASMVVFAENGLSVGADVDVRRNEFVTGQTLRFGMPFDSQVEFGFPYRFVDQSTVASVDTGGSDEVDGFGHGMGDMSVGVAKTLVRENGHWWPDLVGRITWDSGTGKTSSNGVPLGGGFDELRGSLSAVKRQDPLAFVGGVSYETTFEKNDVKPGDQLGFTIGTVLAASPGTSLRLALDQRFVDTAKSNGEGINGSDFVSATATLGASVVLGPGVLLDVAADIGLTDDAPDYAARASLPIRFNLPVY